MREIKQANMQKVIQPVPLRKGLVTIYLVFLKIVLLPYLTGWKSKIHLLGKIRKLRKIEQNLLITPRPEYLCF